MLDTRLGELVGLTPDATLDRYQRFGIELEYEGNRNRRNAAAGWAAIPDGSLRDNGVEYVSLPLTYREVSPSLRRILAVANRNGCRATPRCGLHVHLNMRPYNGGQLLSLATVYGLLEPTIFKVFAEGRENSPFCVPQYSNTMLVDALRLDSTSLKNGGRTLRNITATNKYSALNYASLARFGTVEARHKACTLDDREIVRWVQFLKDLVDFSVEFEDPAYVMDEFERGGLAPFQRNLIGRAVTVDRLDQRDAADSCMLMVGDDEADGGAELAPDVREVLRMRMDEIVQFNDPQPVEVGGVDVEDDWEDNEF